MVWDSSNTQVSQRHRGLVQLLKEKRAEGHFAGLPLEQRILVYDAALNEHAHSLKILGLAGQSKPYICLTTLDAKGLPAKILWSQSYSAPDQALSALDQKLGIAHRNQPKEPPVLMLVGGQDDPAWLETRSKLKALLADSWKAAQIQGALQLEASHPEIEDAHLALVDNKTQKVLWTKSIAAPEIALQSLGQRFGLVYKVPDQLDWEKDGSKLLRVAGGNIFIGRDNENMDCPRIQVPLAPYYYMGQNEVTVAQFRRFVQASGRQTDAEKAGRSFVFRDGKFVSVEGANWMHPKGPDSNAQDNFPVVHITYNDAAAYCVWAGLRLPNEAEWENATGGKDFPWGAQWNAKGCQHSVGLARGGAGGPRPVGSFPQGASPWGCLDMAGNVYEWTSNPYQPYLKDGPKNARMHGLRRVIRGGSFGNDEPSDFYTFRRTSVGTQDSTEAQGFRVCLDGTRPRL